MHIEVGPPDLWTVELVDGSRVAVWAGGYGSEGDHYTLSNLAVLEETERLPDDAVLIGQNPTKPSHGGGCRKREDWNDQRRDQAAVGRGRIYPDGSARRKRARSDVIGACICLDHLQPMRSKWFKSEAEAVGLLGAEIAKLRARSYDDLLGLMDNPEDYWVTGPSGTRYGVEVNVLWEDGTRGDGTIRVLAAIDDGGPSARRPLVSDFIRPPDARS
jgi:hypothetical protein